MEMEEVRPIPARRTSAMDFSPSTALEGRNVKCTSTMIKVTYKKPSNETPKRYVERLAFPYQPRGPTELVYLPPPPEHNIDRIERRLEMGDGYARCPTIIFSRKTPLKPPSEIKSTQFEPFNVSLSSPNSTQNASSNKENVARGVRKWRQRETVVGKKTSVKNKVLGRKRKKPLLVLPASDVTDLDKPTAKKRGRKKKSQAEITLDNAIGIIGVAEGVKAKPRRRSLSQPARPISPDEELIPSKKAKLEGKNLKTSNKKKAEKGLPGLRRGKGNVIANLPEVEGSLRRSGRKRTGAQFYNEISEGSEEETRSYLGRNIVSTTDKTNKLLKNPVRRQPVRSLWRDVVSKGQISYEKELTRDRSESVEKLESPKRNRGRKKKHEEIEKDLFSVKVSEDIINHAIERNNTCDKENVDNEDLIPEEVSEDIIHNVTRRKKYVEKDVPNDYYIHKKTSEDILSHGTRKKKKRDKNVDENEDHTSENMCRAGVYKNLGNCEASGKDPNLRSRSSRKKSAGNINSALTIPSEDTFYELEIVLPKDEPLPKKIKRKKSLSPPVLEIEPSVLDPSSSSEESESPSPLLRRKCGRPRKYLQDVPKSSVLAEKTKHKNRIRRGKTDKSSSRFRDKSKAMDATHKKSDKIKDKSVKLLLSPSSNKFMIEENSSDDPLIAQMAQLEKESLVRAPSDQLSSQVIVNISRLVQPDLSLSKNNIGIIGSPKLTSVNNEELSSSCIVPDLSKNPDHALNGDCKKREESETLPAVPSAEKPAIKVKVGVVDLPVVSENNQLKLGSLEVNENNTELLKCLDNSATIDIQIRQNVGQLNRKEKLDVSDGDSLVDRTENLTSISSDPQNIVQLNNNIDHFDSVPVREEGEVVFNGAGEIFDELMIEMAAEEVIAEPCEDLMPDKEPQDESLRDVLSNVDGKPPTAVELSENKTIDMHSPRQEITLVDQITKEVCSGQTEEKLTRGKKLNSDIQESRKVKNKKHKKNKQIIDKSLPNNTNTLQAMDTRELYVSLERMEMHGGKKKSESSGRSREGQTHTKKRSHREKTRSRDEASEQRMKDLNAMSSSSKADDQNIRHTPKKHPKEKPMGDLKKSKSTVTEHQHKSITGKFKPSKEPPVDKCDSVKHKTLKQPLLDKAIEREVGKSKSSREPPTGVSPTTPASALSRLAPATANAHAHRPKSVDEKPRTPKYESPNIVPATIKLRPEPLVIKSPPNKFATTPGIPLTPQTPKDGKGATRIVQVVDLFSGLLKPQVRKERKEVKGPAKRPKVVPSLFAPDPVPAPTPATRPSRPCSPNGKRFDRKSVLEKYIKKNRLPYDKNQFSFSLNLQSPGITVKCRNKPSISRTKELSKTVQAKNQVREPLKAVRVKTPHKFEDSFDLPGGWKRVTRVRVNGESAGRSDVIYYTPDGRRLRSKPEVAKFLKDTGSSLNLEDLLVDDKVNQAVLPKEVSSTCSPYVVQLNQKSDEPVENERSKLPLGWSRKIHTRNNGNSVGRMEVNFISPDGKTLSSKKKLESYFKRHNLSCNLDDFDFSRPRKSICKVPDLPVPKIQRKSISIKKKNKTNLIVSKVPKENNAIVLRKKLKMPLGKLGTNKKIHSDLLSASEEIIKKPALTNENWLDFYRKLGADDHNMAENDLLLDPLSHKLMIATDRSIVENVRALLVASGLSTSRVERRFASLHPAATYGTQHNEWNNEEGVPFDWVQSLVRCRPELPEIEEAALKSLASATEYFIQRMAGQAHLLGGGGNLQYNHVADLVADTPSLAPLKALIPRRVTVQTYRKLSRPSRFFSFTC